MSGSASERPRRNGSLVLAIASVVGILTIAAGVFFDAFRSIDSAAASQVTTNPVVTSDGRTILVQKYEVTITDWNKCYDAGGCSLRIKSRKNTNTDYPATGLNWFDVNEYIAWMNRSASVVFRLPTTQEWNEMAHEVLPDEPDPIFTDPELRWAASYLLAPNTERKLRPSGSFKTTSHGIADLNGSVWEWTSDCYAGADKGFDEGNCPAFFVGGEHIAAIPVFTRDPARGGCAVGSPPPHLGLRLVSDKPV